MCPRGNVCGNCGSPATLEVHWPSWVEKFCDICAPKLVDRNIVKFYDIREDSNEITRVN